MLAARDPKTTYPGIALILIGLISLIFGVGPTEILHAVGSFNLEPILKELLAILAGSGLLAASDNNKRRR